MKKIYLVFVLMLLIFGSVYANELVVKKIQIKNSRNYSA